MPAGRGGDDPVQPGEDQALTAGDPLREALERLSKAAKQRRDGAIREARHNRSVDFDAALADACEYATVPHILLTDLEAVLSALEQQQSGQGGERETVANIIRETVRGEYTGDCAGMDDVTLYGIDAAASAILAALSRQPQEEGREHPYAEIHREMLARPTLRPAPPNQRVIPPAADSEAAGRLERLASAKELAAKGARAEAVEIADGEPESTQYHPEARALMAKADDDDRLAADLRHVLSILKESDHVR